MLLEDHICKVQSQNFPLLQEQYLKQEINNTPCSLYMTLREMFVTKQDMCQMFADEVYNMFYAKNWCTTDDYTLRYEQLATYGVLLSNLVFAYNYDKGTMELHTSSTSKLKQLAQGGMLKGKKEPIVIEIDKLEKTLYNSDRIKKSVRVGDKLVTVRLDTEVKDGIVTMTATVPRTSISLSTHAILPFTSVLKTHELLYTIFQKSICRVTMGDKVRDVSLNESILQSIYGEQRTRNLVSFMPNIYTLRFYVPNIGASKYTPGVTNISIADIDSIKPVSLADIDLSEVNMNYDLVIPYFKKVVSKMKRNSLQKAGQLFNLLYLNADDECIRNNLYNVTTEMYPKEIWEVMKIEPKLFKTDGITSFNSPYGGMQEQVPIPKTPDELRQRLLTGVYRILITKRNGAFSTIICTNNNKFLEQILGSGYIKNESDGVKLRGLANYLSKHSNFTEDETCNAVKQFDCQYMVYGDYETVMENIKLQLANVELNKTVVSQPKLVQVRNLEAYDKSSYYKYIDIKQIVEITRLNEITK